MASYHLEPFNRVDHLSIIAGVEEQSPTRIKVAFWVNDPLGEIIYPEMLDQAKRQDYLWEQTCFEVFLGIKENDTYRELNFSTSGAWQSYQFEEYRYPECIPPVYANDIEIIQLQTTRYGLNVSLDLRKWMSDEGVKLTDIYMGLTAVIKTSQQTHFFAMKHSGLEADFHNKRDWLHYF